MALAKSGGRIPIVEEPAPAQVRRAPHDGLQLPAVNDHRLVVLKVAHVLVRDVLAAQACVAKERQGSALGVYGIGNIGTGIRNRPPDTGHVNGKRASNASAKRARSEKARSSLAATFALGRPREGVSMSSTTNVQEENKAVVMQMLEAFNKRDSAVVPKLLASHARSQSTFPLNPALNRQPLTQRVADLARLPGSTRSERRFAREHSHPASRQHR